MSISTTPPPGQRVTITDVARAASVSRQTVSNAVNNPERLSPDTLERVLGAIERLGYLPQAAAQSLRHQRSGAIGVEIGTLGPRTHNETTAPLLAALGVAAAAHGCHIVPFGSTSPTPMIEGYRDMWRSSLVDAFILTDTHHGDPRPQWLQEHGIPYAAFGRIWDDPTVTRWVDVAGEDGTAQAVEHLAAAGYHRIAFLGWPEGSVVGDHRWRGWDRATAAVPGARPAPMARAPQDLDAARAAAEWLLSELSDGDAIVCASDLLALGVHHALLVSGRRLGQDIGVIGFDGSALAEMHHLSSLAHPIQEIAEGLLDLLQAALAERPAPAEGRLLTPTLITRPSSSGPDPAYRHT